MALRSAHERRPLLRRGRADKLRIGVVTAHPRWLWSDHQCAGTLVGIITALVASARIHR